MDRKRERERERAIEKARERERGGGGGGAREKKSGNCKKLEKSGTIKIPLSTGISIKQPSPAETKEKGVILLSPLCYRFYAGENGSIDSPLFNYPLKKG